MQKTYQEKLKDPRWQKKRLEIFSRDNWMCTVCGETMGTLHAHHLRYDSSLEPWEYPGKDIITLCEQCHDFEHKLQIINKAGLLYKIIDKNNDIYKSVDTDKNQKVLEGLGL